MSVPAWGEAGPSPHSAASLPSDQLSRTLWLHCSICSERGWPPCLAVFPPSQRPLPIFACSPPNTNLVFAEFLLPICSSVPPPALLGSPFLSHCLRHGVWGGFLPPAPLFPRRHQSPHLFCLWPCPWNPGARHCGHRSPLGSPKGTVFSSWRGGPLKQTFWARFFCSPVSSVLGEGFCYCRAEARLPWHRCFHGKPRLRPIDPSLPASVFPSILPFLLLSLLSLKQFAESLLCARCQCGNFILTDWPIPRLWTKCLSCARHPTGPWGTQADLTAPCLMGLTPCLRRQRLENREARESIRFLHTSELAGVADARAFGFYSLWEDGLPSLASGFGQHPSPTSLCP